jgi:mono/diheme cytochrome c family protein
LATRRPQ